jgi:DDE superfamily endonuclease
LIGLLSVQPGLPVRYWCQDETRLGLKTIQRRKITAPGVKPIGQVQWQREATYLYGIVDPLSGEPFFYEFSHLDSVCFERFLTLVSQHFPDTLNLMQLDQASAHTAKRLHVPDNIVLIFQPSHAPELNPIEFGGNFLNRSWRGDFSTPSTNSGKLWLRSWSSCTLKQSRH